MDALSLIEHQHAEVDELFEEMESTDDDEGRTLLFAELADHLAAHAAMEERLFYPAVVTDDTEELLGDSVEQHLAVKRMLAELLRIEVADERFDAKLALLKQHVEHHAHEEEEGELFPLVRKAFTPDQLLMLGGEMAELFHELMRGHPRLNVPLELEQPVSLL